MAQGSIRQRGKRWYIVYPYRAPDGSYKRKWERAIDAGYPDTRRGAERALRQRLTELDDGHNPSPASLTVRDYLDTWHAGRHTLRASTAYAEHLTIQKRINAHLGDIVLSNLTRTDIRHWHSTLLATYQPSTINRTHQILVTALGDALEDRLVRENVAAKVRPPRQERGTGLQLWTTEQVRTFLTACEDDLYGAFWQLVLLTGLRRGEAIALRWEDVRLDDARLTVNRTLTKNAQGNHAFGPPKTRGSHRTVDLPASLVAALRAERDRQVFQRDRAGRHWQEHGLVFTTANGTMLRPSTLKLALDDLITRCGLPRLTLHQFRHLHATMLMAAGVHPKVVSERLGHSRIGITLDLYSHVSETLQRDAADTIDAVLENADDSKSDSNGTTDAANS